MSSSALTAAGSSGPAWQVDIPGLSQLILSAGSYGLKQLASSGVDIHSIGCMLMIAEYVPASKDFRSTLNRARELQRSERLWMYKVVEIGTATNFLADQMLKTRAGENVLALLSATIPVMDETSCTSLLSTLFELTKASPDNIPGIKELQSIRDNLAPLARKTGFRERVLRHHHWLWRLLQAEGPPKSDDPYNAIPVPTDIPKIIRLLHKIVTSDDTYVMIYKGIRGAAWVVTYACSVLGLNVCALDKKGDPVPISGRYEDAQVVLELASREGTCQLYLAGVSTEDMISLAEPMAFKRRGWSIDCSSVNFLELQHRGITNSPTFSRLSYFAALETMNAVTRWASSLHGQSILVNGAPGIVPYTLSVLKVLQERSLNILTTLGFRPGAYDDFNFVPSFGAETYDVVGHKSDFAPRLLVARGDGIDKELRKRRYHPKSMNYSRDGQYIAQGGLGNVNDESVQRLQIYLAPRTPSVFGYNEKLSLPRVVAGAKTECKASFNELHPSLQSAVMATLAVAVNFASKLAFSDWNTTFGCMSVRAMAPYGDSDSYRSEENNFEGPMSEAIELCVDGVKMVDLETRLWTRDWVALNLDGVVVFRQLSRQYSIHDLNGKYLSFSPGQLLYEGLPCAKIRSDRTSLMYRPFEAKLATPVRKARSRENCTAPSPRDQGSPSSSNIHDYLSPGYRTKSSLIPNKFEDSCTWGYRQLCSRLGDTIFIRLEITVQPNAHVTVDSSKAASHLPEVFVTDSCEHGFGTNGLKDGLLDNYPMLGLGNKVFEGLSFGEKSKNINIFYQHTSRSPLGQWLGCHWDPLVANIHIFQRDCCLKCLFNRLQKAQPKVSAYQLCIIAGGNTKDGSFDRRERSHSQPPASSISDRFDNPYIPHAWAKPFTSKSNGDEELDSSVVQSLKTFFLEGWVTESLSEIAYYIDRSQSKSSSVMDALRKERNYCMIQAAFVVEAIGEDSDILRNLQRNKYYQALISDWNELIPWLNGQAAIHSFQSIYSAMRNYQAVHFKADPKKDRPLWGQFKASRQESSSQNPTPAKGEQMPKSPQQRPLKRKPVPASGTVPSPGSFERRLSI